MEYEVRNRYIVHGVSIPFRCFANKLTVVDVDTEHQLELLVVEHAFPLGDGIEAALLDTVVRFVFPIQTGQRVSVERELETYNRFLELAVPLARPLI